jgi:acetoin utilization protein AcuB
MKVKDVFSKRVYFTTPEATLLDAAEIIFGKNHKGIPVVDKLKKVVGFITEQDIMSQVFPKVSELMEDYIHERDFEAMENNLRLVLEKKVKNVMTKKVTTIHEDDPMLKAESIMKLNDISRLPVVDAKKKLIGIISKGDIFRALVSRKARGFK